MKITPQVVARQQHTPDELFARVSAAAAGKVSAWQGSAALLSGPVEDDVRCAYLMAMDALRFFAVPGEGSLPSPDDAQSFAGASGTARALVAIAAQRATRAAVLAFDATSLAIWVDVHEALVEDQQGGSSAAALAAARGWAALLAADADQALASAEELRTLAVAHSLAGSMIESQVLKAMAASSSALEDAVAHGRRASRMARTESLPQEEYLANLVLARLRRFQGKPHLAARILASLLRVAPSPWRPWMMWELSLAGAPVDVGALGTQDTPSANAVRELNQLLRAARSGKRASFDDAARSLLGHVEGIEDLAREAETVAALLDPTRTGSMAVQSFRSGKTDAIPHGLGGLAVSHGESEAAHVFSSAEQRTRVLTPGIALLGDAHRLASVHRQARTDSTISAVLLSGPDGIAEDELFARVYGFAYQPSLHQSVRGVLYHRVRQRLGSSAELARENGRMTIRHAGALLTPDPRCSPPAEHALLLVLASAGRTSAKEAAELLGIPIRTAQDALRRLVEEGACRAVKEGRRLHYHVEDTTYLDPTKV